MKKSYTIYKKYIELPQSYDLENKDVEFIAKFLKTVDI